MLGALLALLALGGLAFMRSGETVTPKVTLRPFTAAIQRPEWWPTYSSMFTGWTDRPVRPNSLVHTIGNIGIGQTVTGKSVFPIHSPDRPALPADATGAGDKYSFARFPVAKWIDSATFADGASGWVDEWGRAYSGPPSPFWTSPLWDVAKTASYAIPGIGPAVSGGLAGLQALGQGASLGNATLAAARGALPPGPQRVAFDMGVGAIAGEPPTADQLNVAREAVRSELGPGEAIAFDKGVDAARALGD